MNPSGVAMESGRIYVTDSGNDRVVVMDGTGGVLEELSDSTGALDDPFGIAAIHEPEWNHYGSRFVVVSGGGKKTLTKVSLSGTAAHTVSYGEISDRDGGFYFVAIDYFSNVYVTDEDLPCRAPGNR